MVYQNPPFMIMSREESAREQKKGNPKYLTDDDEAMLVSFVEKCASIGYPRTRQQVLTHRQIDRHDIVPLTCNTCR